MLAKIESMINVGLLLLVYQAVANQIQPLDISKTVYPERHQDTDENYLSSFDSFAESLANHYNSTHDGKAIKGNRCLSSMISVNCTLA